MAEDRGESVSVARKKAHERPWGTSPQVDHEGLTAVCPKTLACAIVVRATRPRCGLSGAPSTPRAHNPNSHGPAQSGIDLRIIIIGFGFPHNWKRV